MSNMYGKGEPIGLLREDSLSENFYGNDGG